MPLLILSRAEQAAGQEVEERPPTDRETHDESLVRARRRSELEDESQRWTLVCYVGLLVFLVLVFPLIRRAVSTGKPMGLLLAVVGMFILNLFVDFHRARISLQLGTLGPSSHWAIAAGVPCHAKCNWKQYVYSSAIEKQESALDDDSCCCICLHEYEQDERVTELPCAHVYHKSCIDAWTDCRLNCPLCNRNLGTLLV
jgi:Ring finger domain